MKLLATSDWQCSLSNLDRCEQVLAHLLELIQKHQVDYVLHLGDVKDAFNPVDVRVMNFLVHATEAITKHCPFLVLLGNHDRVGTADDSDDCFPILQSAGAITFTKPTTYPLKSGVDLMLVPFLRDLRDLKDAFRKVAPKQTSRNSVTLLGFHSEVIGCQYSVVRQGGGLSTKDMRTARYDLCLGGHIHYQQKIGKNIWYVGSPFCHDWGEANQGKGFLLIEVSKGRTEVTPIPGQLPGWYDPTLPNFPKPKNIRFWQDAHVRTHITITSSDPAAEVAAARKRNAAAYPGAVLHVIAEASAAVSANLPDTLRGNDEQLLRRYLQSIDCTGDSAEETVAYLLHKLPQGNAVGIEGLRFLEIEAEDALSFERCQVSLDLPGLTLITGKNLDWGGRSNGSGKSSFLSLPGLALFGETPKGQTHDDWKRQGAKTSLVRQKLRLADGRVCNITRRRPAGLSVSVNGRDLTLGDVRATQKLIESLTNLTWDVLMNSLYIGQLEVGTILTGTDKMRKELFSRFLGLERFLTAQQKINADRSLLRGALVEVEADIQGKEAAIAECKNTLAGLPKAPEFDPNDLIISQTEVERCDKHIDKLTRLMESKTAWLDKNQKRFEVWLDKSVRAETTLNNLKEHLEKVATISKSGGVCPLCNSRTSVKSLENHERVLEQQIQEQEAILGKYEKLQEANRTLRRKAREKDEVRQKKIKQWQALRESAQKHLIELQQVQKRVAELDQLKTQHQQRLKSLQASHEIHNRYRKQLLDHGRFLEFCMSVVGRDGLPAYLCAAVTPQLNHSASRFSAAFADNEIQVRFQISGGEIDVDIVNAHGGKALQDQSMGEMRMAGLITCFAFRDVLVPHNILILDEPGEGLDAISAKAFAKGLNTVVERFGSVFLVTHNPFILAEVEPARHLVVTKHNGISTLTSTK